MKRIQVDACPSIIRGKECSRRPRCTSTKRAPDGRPSFAGINMCSDHLGNSMAWRGPLPFGLSFDDPPPSSKRLLPVTLITWTTTRLSESLAGSSLIFDMGELRQPGQLHRVGSYTSRRAQR
ncbi:hypothetical protein DM872_09625 [Pseudomonas taiwanensis]|nr:hypothetical protein [Pseudomonas taiwanensis]